MNLVEYDKHTRKEKELYVYHLVSNVEIIEFLEPILGEGE